MKKFITTLVFTLLSTLAFSQVIMIMGGEKHDVYLGNLNTGVYDTNSIWNKYGDYGNKYNSDCIWNKYGNYGNKYSSYSPWNKYSSSSPVLVDAQGNYYGIFNESNSNKLIRAICKIAKAIQDGDIELQEAYEMLFE